MRYKEFEERIKTWGEKYGYETEVEIKCIYVYVKTKFGMLFKRISRIRTDSTWALDTDWSSFTDIKEDSRVELFSILLEFAKTPPEDREDEKNFIIPLPELTTTDGEQQYLSQQYLSHKDCKFFASRRDEALRQIWKEKHLEYVPKLYRQFAVEFDEGKEY